MEFAKEYFGEWVKDDKYEYAELLWLWYDYYTETYDRRLPNVVSPYDSTSVIPVGESRNASGKNAALIRNDIYWVAKHYGIDNELMQRAKVNRFQKGEAAQYRIDLFLQYREQGKFRFMQVVL